jgi:hydroxylamine reductase
VAFSSFSLRPPLALLLLGRNRHFVLSWFEQKAVAVLLTLLHLGVKNIHIGPALPAFITPNVLKVLVDNYALTPIGDVEADLKKFLKQ